jgi:hypothetical protein
LGLSVTWDGPNIILTSSLRYGITGTYLSIKIITLTLFGNLPRILSRLPGEEGH